MYQEKDVTEYLLPGDEKERRSSLSKPKYRTTFLLLPAVLLLLLASVFSFIELEHKFQHSFQIPAPPPLEVCDHATARPSWHALPAHRRHGYTRAVQRLATLPSRLGLDTSLYDDFTYVHTQLVWQVHRVAIALPFHRYFVYIFEQTLRKEGGYDGPMPFWDWTVDASSPLESSVWDPRNGFGGNGDRSKGGCVEYDVFSRMGKLANYSEQGYQPHCVKRSFDTNEDDGLLHANKWKLPVVKAIVDEAKTFDDFRQRLEDGPHRHLHWGIGGEMPTSSSTNDPLFFLHHAQIDRLWWLWQQKNPGERNEEFFGPVMREDEELSKTGANIEDKIRMLGLAADISVRDVMRTDTGLLCYKYRKDL